MSPRQRYDAAVERLADAAMSGDRAAALRALADAEAFAPSGVVEENAAWLEREQRRVVDLAEREPDADPGGWGR